MPGMAINQEQMMKRKQPDSPSHHTSEVPASAAQVSSARAAETLSNKRQALPAKEGSDPFTPEYHDKATFFQALAQVGRWSQNRVIDRLISHVARGEQQQAQALLAAHPDLAQGKGSGTEHSGRQWQGITAFQLAVWSLDWHMWRMIKGFMTDEAAREQLLAMPTITARNGNRGPHFDFTPLLTAYQRYLNQWQGWREARNWDAMERCWIKEVGGAQWDVPAHVAQEYCHPSRALHPTPSFTEDDFPRSLRTDEGDWWTARYNGALLGGHGFQGRGVKWACERVRVGCHQCEAQWGGMGMRASDADLSAVSKLCRVRTEQLRSLRASIQIDPPAASPGASHN